MIYNLPYRFQIFEPASGDINLEWFHCWGALVNSPSLHERMTEQTANLVSLQAENKTESGKACDVIAPSE